MRSIWPLLAVAACSGGEKTGDPPPACPPPAERVVCDGVHVVNDELEAYYDPAHWDDTLEDLRGCTHVKGSISTFDSSDLDALSSLVEVTGDLSLGTAADDARPDLASLVALQRVGGVFSISRGADTSGLGCLAEVDQLSLTDAQDIDLSGLSALTMLDALEIHRGEADLSGLTAVRGLRSLVLNGTVPSVAGPGYAETLTALTIGADAQLDSLQGLEGVTRIEELTFESDGGLDDLTGLDGVQTIGGPLVLDRMAMKRLDGLGALEEVEGELRLRWTERKLQALGLDALHTVRGNVILEGQMPAELDGLQALQTIDGDLRLDSSTVETWAGLPALASVDDIHIAAFALTELGPIAVPAVDRLDIHAVQIADLDSFKSLRTARFIEFRDTGIQHLGGFDVLEAADLAFWHNFDLVTIDAFGALRDGGEGGNFTTDDSTEDPTNVLGPVGGPRIEFYFCGALERVGFDAMESASYVLVSDGDAFTGEGFEALEQVGELWLSDNAGMTTLAPLDGVQRVDTAHIEWNANLCQSEVDAWIDARMVIEAVTQGNDDGC